MFDRAGDPDPWSTPPASGVGWATPFVSATPPDLPPSSLFGLSSPFLTPTPDSSLSPGSLSAPGDPWEGFLAPPPGKSVRVSPQFEFSRPSLLEPPPGFLFGVLSPRPGSGFISFTPFCPLGRRQGPSLQRPRPEAMGPSVPTRPRTSRAPRQPGRRLGRPESDTLPGLAGWETHSDPPLSQTVTCGDPPPPLPSPVGSPGGGDEPSSGRLGKEHRGVQDGVSLHSFPLWGSRGPE